MTRLLPKTQQMAVIQSESLLTTDPKRASSVYTGSEDSNSNHHEFHNSVAKGLMKHHLPHALERKGLCKKLKELADCSVDNVLRCVEKAGQRNEERLMP